MAKISPVAIKYMIHANFEAEGTLEKPDVIGAIFGQTEGLLGTELEMRDLQKEGKIGRIEVNLEMQNTKTIGKIEIPSALDKTETTLIAAAIETIERIGPSVAKISIEKIEDIRENKRDYILERAKKLLEGIEEKMPKSREIAEGLKIESRAGKVREYGEEKLSSGNIEGKELIVVEGRADVMNLLRNGVNNVIAMSGTKLPESIKQLSYEKEVTLFLDGDRGGMLIARNVIDNAKVDFVTFAPDGKEVEELSGKEILMSLRRKISAEEFLKSIGKTRRVQEIEKEDIEETTTELDETKMKEYLNEIANTRRILVLDNRQEVIGDSNSRSLFSYLERVGRKAVTLVLDSVSSNVLRTAEDCNIKNVVAKNFSHTGETKINLVSL